MLGSLMYSNLYTGSHEQEQKRKSGFFSSFNSSRSSRAAGLEIDSNSFFDILFSMGVLLKFLSNLDSFTRPFWKILCSQLMFVFQLNVRIYP